MASAIWPKYTAVQTGPGPSNESNVMNRFAIFEFFAEQVVKEKPVRRSCGGQLDQAERRERRDRSATQRHAHHDSG